jgi:hypothetical protein
VDSEEDINDAGEDFVPQTVDDVRKMFGDRQREYPDPRQRRKSRRPGQRPQPGFPPPRKKHAQASERASILGQMWVDLGNAAGFQFPYDVNYFALGLQAQIESDPEMQALLQRDEHDKVERWVEKMIERWWAEYVSNEIRSGTAKDFFLRTDWDDLREYARTCLRAAYLLENGSRKTPSDTYLAAGRELHDRLAEMAAQDRATTYAKKTLEADQAPLELDPKGRDRLRSWREKRRQK